jgi:hypothetical protein
MAYGAPKKPKAGYKEGRRGLGAAPYDHVDPGMDQLDGPVKDEVQFDFFDPDEGSNQITPARTEAMTNQVRSGVPVTVAAAALGIEKDVWNHWCRTGRAHKEKKLKGGFGAGESPYVYFVNELNKAKAQAESMAVQKWFSAIEGDWKAAQAWLERTASARWHLTTKMEIAAKSGSDEDVGKWSTAKLLQAAKGQLEAGETKALTAGEEPVDGIIEEE